jgi:hypothetical protein
MRMDKYEECGLCGVPLDEDEHQYCIGCEINMLKEIAAEIQTKEGV